MLGPSTHKIVLALLRDLLYSKNIHCADWEYRPTSVNPQSKVFFVECRGGTSSAQTRYGEKLGGTLRTDAWSPT